MIRDPGQTRGVKKHLDEMVAAVAAAGARKLQKPGWLPILLLTPFSRIRISSSSQPGYLLCDPRPHRNLSVPTTVYRIPQMSGLAIDEEGRGKSWGLDFNPSPCQSPVSTVRPKKRWE